MIERADISGVLAQMRQIQADAQSGITNVNKMMPELSTQEVNKAEEIGGENFGSLLKDAVDKVNATQSEASRMVTAYEMGDESVELTQVMVQLQKASVSFQALTQVRNRLVTAYEDVMKMPV